MNALIVYDSQFGNTERIARAIAEWLGSARLLRVEAADALERTTCNLLIAAGPTQRQKTSPAMQAWLERLPRGALKDVPAAAFDTRYRMSRFLTGSAAQRIASRLKRAGKLLRGAQCAAARREAPPRDGAAGAGRGGACERLGYWHPREDGCSAVSGVEGGVSGAG